MGGSGNGQTALEDEMRFLGVDVGSQSHVVAMVDEDLHILLKPTSFGEDAAGYDKLRKLLGEVGDCRW